MKKKQEVRVRPNDHLITIGREEETGRKIGALLHEDGSSESVVFEERASGIGSKETTHRFETCKELGLSGVSHVVTIGHRGPALSNCDAFREQIEKMFGPHRLDPNHPDFGKDTSNLN